MNAWPDIPGLCVNQLTIAPVITKQPLNPNAMTTPYDLIFEPQELVSAGPVERLPGWCRFVIAFAKQRHYYRLQDMEIVSQHMPYAPFDINLTELKVSKSTPVRFNIRKRALFLFFIVQGGYFLSTGNDIPITRINSNTFFMLYYDPGRYVAHMDKGHHSIVLVKTDPEWIDRSCTGLHHIRQLLEGFRESSRPYDMLYPSRMDRKVHRWLYKLYHYSGDNFGVLEGNIRKYISHILGHYDAILKNNPYGLAYRVKSYLDDHYRDRELNMTLLASHFCATKRTLRNNFKQEYTMTPHQYYSRLRVTHGLALMQQYHYTTRQVYDKIGYGDESSFRYALKQFRKNKAQ